MQSQLVHLLIAICSLLKTLFPMLTSTTSSSIRKSILKTILSDVKNANAKTQNHKFNRLVQGLLYDMIERSSAIAVANGGSASAAAPGGPKTVADYSGTGAKKNASTSRSSENAGKEAMWAVKLASELWRKGIWRDARTANLISAACFHSNTKVQSVAMHFFLNSSGSSNFDGSDSDSSDDDPNEAMASIRKVKHQQTINKKKKSTDKAAKKEIRKANTKRKAAELKEAEGLAGQIDNSALNLLHDPQTFAEKLYDLIAKNDKRFTLEHKVLIMQLFGRLTGLHKLYVLSFYSYITKYLVHHQLQITTILVALASSVHELVPPDALTPVIQKLAHEFVHPGVSSQVVAAGLNAIREICARQHWCMQPDLLEDLVEYRKSKDKGVMVASRALLQLYRDVNPDMLRRRERGKTATMNAIAGKAPPGALQYGTQKDILTNIEGLDLLEAHLEEKKAEKEAAKAALGEDGAADDAEVEEEEDGWEVASSDSDDSDEEGWIAVSSDEEDGGKAYFNDSEDEDERAERRERKKRKQSVVSEAASDGEALQAGKLEVTQDEIAELDKDEAEKKENSLAFATTRILTPADFVKLNELRTAAAEAEVKAGGGGAAKRKLALLQAAKKALKKSGAITATDGQGILTESQILGASKKAKADYEERMASIAKGREGREKFGSNKGKKKKEIPSSSTNKEKRKKTKAFSMVQHSKEVMGKGRASLRAKQRRLKGYSRSQKKNAAKAARL